MQGRRLPGSVEWPDSLPGDYWRHKGKWYVCLPNGDNCDISTWEVIEHEDGTISVSPSINSVGRWHGWLKRGVFIEAAC